MALRSFETFTKPICSIKFFGIPKCVERLVQLEFEHKGLFGTPVGVSVPFPLSQAPTKRLEPSREGVGFGPPSHVYSSVSRVHFSRVEKRCGCKVSRNPFGFVQAHPRALSDVAPSAFGPHGL